MDSSVRNLVDLLCPECTSKHLKIEWVRMSFDFNEGVAAQDLLKQTDTADEFHVSCAHLFCETCKCALVYEAPQDYWTTQGNIRKFYKRRKGEGMVLVRQETLVEVLGDGRTRL